MKPHRATLILVFGILSLVVCAPLGIFAWVMGNGDLKLMDSGQMDPSGRDTTNVGRILGMIGTILLAVGLLIAAVMMVLAIVGAIGASQMPQNH